MDIHTPSSFQISGSSSTVEVWNTRVRINEITAETMPLFSAVKKDEAKIYVPAKR